MSGAVGAVTGVDVLLVMGSPNRPGAGRGQQVSDDWLTISARAGSMTGHPWTNGWPMSRDGVSERFRT